MNQTDLILAIIVNFRQVSPVDLFLGLIDKFDRPTSRTDVQGLDFDNSFVYQDHLTQVKQTIDSFVYQDHLTQVKQTINLRT